MKDYCLCLCSLTLKPIEYQFQYALKFLCVFDITVLLIKRALTTCNSEILRAVIDLMEMHQTTLLKWKIGKSRTWNIICADNQQAGTGGKKKEKHKINKYKHLEPNFAWNSSWN